MLATILNNWHYNGLPFKVGDTLEIPEDIFEHLFATSIVQKVTDPNVEKVYSALITQEPISDEVKEAIKFSEDIDRWIFVLPTKVLHGDGSEEIEKIRYCVRKDPNFQKIDHPTPVSGVGG